MTPLRTFLEEKRRRQEKILSVYLTAGYPHPSATLPLLKAVVEGGADMIELGIPFSDPQADGPTIQEASQQALAEGMTTAGAIKILAEFRRSSEVPVLLMGYANPFYQMGWEELLNDTAAAGNAGFIIPDMPPEESVTLGEAMAAQGMSLINLVSPNTPESRIAMINERTTGFIYAVSVTGITGARNSVPEQTTRFLKNLRQQTDHPFLVGFGVSNAETARALSQLSDGVIIGSAVINRIAAAKDVESACASVREFLQEIKAAI